MKTPKPQPVPIKIGGVPFSKLSKAAQRVAIAQDALDQIKVENYIIKTGHWADIDIITPEVDNGDIPDIDQQALLHGLPPIERKIECCCCAIGAAFLSSIRLANKAVIEGGCVNNMKEASDQLGNYFSLDQLELIEEAFELGYGNSKTVTMKGAQFGDRYDDETDRAKAIFANIVKNKGEFKP